MYVNYVLCYEYGETNKLIWNCYAVTIFLSVLAGPSPCHLPEALDIGVIVDSSSSIGEKNFQKVKELLRIMVQQFDVLPHATHFGVIVYSNEAKLLTDFSNAKYHR